MPGQTFSGSVFTLNTFESVFDTLLENHCVACLNRLEAHELFVRCLTHRKTRSKLPGLRGFVNLSPCTCVNQCPLQLRGKNSVPKLLFLANYRFT
jgi:hypothetical protein